MTSELFEKLVSIGIDKKNILLDEPMSKHTTLKIGGPAECYIMAKTIEDIQKILKFVKENNLPIHIIGNGSNILVHDDGIKGIVLSIGLNNIEIENESKIRVSAGVKLGKLAQVLLQNELTGFEELSGIPGTIGGAIYMNAGAYGKEVKDVITKVIAIDMEGNKKEFKNSDLKFEYRNSIFKKEKYIIVEAELELQKGNYDKIKEKMKQYLESRKKKQPLEYPNAGSTFKRGDNFVTAQLIDEAGLKGYTIGGAMVSTKHAGFIVNKGNATCKDVLELIDYIKSEINKKFGINIELEIEII